MTKNKWPKPAYEFDVPVYPGRVYVYQSREDYNAAYKFLGLDRSVDESVAGRCEECSNKDGDLIYLIGEFEGSTNTLCHEFNHCAFMVLKRVGIDARNDYGEAFCYLQAAMLKLCGVK